MGPFKFTSVAALTALLAACGSSGSSVVLVPGSATASPAQLPTSPAFAVTSVIEPAASAGSTSLTVPLPSSPGYAGRAVFPLASIPANLRLTVTYTNHAPSGISALSTLRQPSSARPALLEGSSTAVVYACFAPNSALNVDAKPQFSFTLPPGFATGSVAYNLAIERAGEWTTGYGGPGTIAATATSATVSAAGRFGFTVPANGSVCIALYGRSTSASTPVPATPGPSASPTAVPTATPSTRPTATPMATATPHGAPTATPMPTATPTLSPSISFSPATLSVLGLGSSFALTTLLHETDDSLPVLVAAPSCAGIATVVSTTGSGPSFTVTGLAVGTCTATATNTVGLTATLHVSVTTSSIGVNAVGRKR